MRTQSYWASGFQVVPPCGGHRKPVIYKCHFLIVSSRAPVWGASNRGQADRVAGGRFKSCPRVGGILIFRRRVTRNSCFKSCPRVGGIGRTVPLDLSGEFVSSRAPVWGASNRGQADRVAGGRFKSCPRVGGILIFRRRVTRNSCFKSCPRVGGIGRTVPLDLSGEFVSSRAPVWGASGGLDKLGNYLDGVSSRAPVWGASFRSERARDDIRFQVVPPCGGHPQKRPVKSSKLWFQVVPPCGGHLQAVRLSQWSLLFQVVPPCGGHRIPGADGNRPRQVSSRAPVWGASKSDRRRPRMPRFQVVPPCGGHPAPTMSPVQRTSVSSRAPVWGASYC